MVFWIKGVMVDLKVISVIYYRKARCFCLGWAWFCSGKQRLDFELVQWGFQQALRLFTRRANWWVLNKIRPAGHVQQLQAPDHQMYTFSLWELTATSEDYKLLENMNKATMSSYQEMKNVSGSIIRSLKDLDRRCKIISFILPTYPRHEEIKKQ